MSSKNKWFKYNILPPVVGTIVIAILDTGEIKLAQFDVDVNRSTWLIKGSAGLFWVSLISSVEYWRYITLEESDFYDQNKYLTVNSLDEHLSLLIDTNPNYYDLGQSVSRFYEKFGQKLKPVNI